MSRQRRKLLLILGLTLSLASGAMYAVLGNRGYETPASKPGEPPRPALLERAIRAHGGAERLAAIRTIRSRAIGHESGRRTEATVSIALPDRYHHEVVTGDARLILASDGKTTWSTLDDVPVPVEDADLLRLQEQMAMVRCGFLVGLRDDDGISTTYLGMRDDLEWLEVEFDDSDVGPFVLGFDPSKALLMRAEWKASMEGRFVKVPMSVAFSDYRAVSGIMVGFSATITVDEQQFAKETLEEVVLGAEIDESTFTQPSAPASAMGPVIDRTSTQEQVVLLSEIPGDPAEGEKIVSTFLDEFSLSRNGPFFRDLDGEKVIAVGAPVQLSEAAAPPAAQAGAPRCIVAGSRRMLTTVVTDAEPEKLQAAEQRLRDRAREIQVEAAGPLRHVAWKDSIVQVQLPVKGN